MSSLGEEFARQFGGVPSYYRAPGRVNLIGEHTDYNDGFVMPAALEYEAEAAAALNGTDKIRLFSLNNGESATFDLSDPAPKPLGNWTDYAFGVAVKLKEAGKPIRGIDIAVSSSVPVGSGLSSSAAFEVVTGFALLSLIGEQVDTVELAKICQKAENEYVGMRCGIMDQFISCNGVHDHALMIDCRSLATRSVPLDPKARVVVANSMVHHALAGGEYNKRRESCEEGVRLLRPALGEIAALRDVTIEDLEENRDFLPEVTYRRCRHIITENERVLDAADALENGDLKTFGRLMNASHASMRDDYEISCPEIDILVEIGQRQTGVYGSRMTGGGFGGCTVSLVEAEHVDAFIENVAAEYEKATGLKSPIFACAPQAGVSVLQRA
ncbi:galactokinase [Martelella sp. HB161492]|uniref:galactokinase n=1 Tax=Martelella sp. HB161492 TaxID=2720726 RepID=UPI00159248DC|nr:galactokinase [Martelella sp. HB161492]